MNPSTSSVGTPPFRAGMVGAVIGGLIVGGLTIGVGRLLTRADRTSVGEVKSIDAGDPDLTNRLTRVENAVASLVAAFPTSGPDSPAPSANDGRSASSPSLGDDRIPELSATLHQLSSQIADLRDRFNLTEASRPAASASGNDSADLRRRLDGIESSGRDIGRDVAKLAQIIRDAHLSSFTSLQDFVPHLDILKSDVTALTRRVDRLEASQ